ncbi:hypothetical protein PVAND_002863 [Polypedilum vanderplanki]|uniref:Histone-lysine N-methyltransferase n=1 Tax=Polypedilum vanderplanki TaxID=319348 RepID=A0A9J6BSE9_POLVA|nr:hypothetical protein PVAND_002863 [Polypedilum vanderplanki]
MPRVKSKRSIESSGSESPNRNFKKSRTSDEFNAVNNNNYQCNSAKKMKNKKKRTSIKEIPVVCDVNKILSYRLNPASPKVILECLVEWANAGPNSNSWEGMDNLRYNLIFQEFIHNEFNKHEMEIFVKIANFKQKLRSKIRKIYNENPKWYIMHSIVQPFDPFEYKAHQVFYHLIKNIPEKFTILLEELVIKNYFFKLEQTQRTKAGLIADKMSELEGITIVIDNEEDFELPPEFEYITKNFLVDDVNQSFVEEPKDIPSGCKCVSCGPTSECCPMLASEPFAYKEANKRTVIGLKRQEAIIECNENCKCNKKCINRVTQQSRNLVLCLFKTANRGWGVKNADRKSVIKRGTFVLEYTGEVLGNHEASKRKVHSYLFDLNMERNNHGFYTIDAYKHGSLARFVNHSCEPNCSMWFINDCLKNPKNQKLCIFADRDIKYDEELTIDYCPRYDVPTSDQIDYSQKFICECHCGSSLCRGNIY